MTAQFTLGAPPAARVLPQWWALTTRGVSGAIRTGEIIYAFTAPALLGLCFYLPLRSIMNATPGMDYGTFLMPIIALQAVSFAASSAAMRAARDAQLGVSTRLRTLPMPRVVPSMARLSTNVVMLLISVGCAAVTSLLMGWRPEGGGALSTIGVFAVALAVGLLMAILADAIGVLADSPEATSQALSLPTMILGMLSTGFMPASSFPEWIQPFVRNQPISQFANGMRDLNAGTATVHSLTPTLWWLAGLAALAVVMTVLGIRKTAR